MASAANDPTHTAPAAGRLTRRLRGCYRAQFHVWCAQGALLGVFAGLVLLSIALASGAPSLRGDPMGIAVSVGCLVTLLWVGVAYRSFGAWCARMDRRLQLEGALLAGLQADSRGWLQPVEQLLARDLEPRTDRARIFQQGIRLHLWLVALPFLAGAVLLQGVKAQRAGDSNWQAVGGQLQGLQDDLNAAMQAMQNQSSPEEASPTSGETVAVLQTLVRDARALAIQEELGQDSEPEWAQAMQDLAQRVEQAGSQRTGDAQADRALAEADQRLDWLVEQALQRSGQSADAETPTDPGPDGNPPNAGSPAEATDGLDAGWTAGWTADARGPSEANGGAGPAQPTGPQDSAASRADPLASGSTGQGKGSNSQGTPGEDAPSKGPDGPAPNTPRPPGSISIGPQPPPAYRTIVRRWLEGERSNP